MLEDSEVERVLVVAAHPDDVDFGAAGTIASWTAAGIEVTYCICTDGDAGGFDPTVDRAEIPGIRRAEQQAAAAVVGVTDVRFLGYPDGALEATQDLRRDISRVIRQVRPQRMLIRARSATGRGSAPATPTTWRPGARRSRRSTPTRATRSRTRRCWPTRSWTRGQSPRRG